MKTTVEIPDALFRRAKVAAAHRGVPLRQLFAEAVEAKLAEPIPTAESEPGWRRALRDFRPPPRVKKELARISKLVEAEFETIEPEDAL